MRFKPDIGLGTPARMIKLTEQRKISRYIWVHLDEGGDPECTCLSVS
jgi:hypothetical protein